MLPEFRDLITETQLAKGKNDITARIMGILYASVEPVSLEELANLTGYSLSAVSMTMKFLILDERIKRVKIQGSKKAYFFMEKDLIPLSIKLIKITEKQSEKLNQKIPEIISKYEKNKKYEKEVRTLKEYNKQVQFINGLYAGLVKKLRDYK